MSDKTSNVQPHEKGQVGRFGYPQEDALPFTITFNEIEPPGELPRLQSFQSTTLSTGHWLILGGRGVAPRCPHLQKENFLAKTGEHSFFPSAAGQQNFPEVSFNTNIFVYDPTSGELKQCDTTKYLRKEVRVPLSSTGQQSWFDRETGDMWIIGGYGWTDAQTDNDMVTFGALIRVNAPRLAEAILKEEFDKVDGLFDICNDDRLAVTGGGLVQIDKTLYLLFGQRFKGQYFTFGDQGKTPQEQMYLEKIQAVEMVPGKFEILDISAVAQPNPEECHRRDLNAKMVKDPTTKETRVCIYGGVFKHGGPLGFEHPILFDPSKGTITICKNGYQLFNAYSTPAIGMWAEEAGVMSQVFFGGISHGVYHVPEVPKGKEAVLDNDGMPFGMDISVMTHHYDGTWQEYVLEEHIHDKDNKQLLLATNGKFIMHHSLHEKDMVSDEEIILVDKLPQGEKTLLGWVYGGILADLPQPPKGPPSEDVVPTEASNKVFEVWVTPEPGTAIPVLSS